MRIYERLDLAFLYEFTVGLLAVYCTFAIGPKGVAAWFLMGFRPLVLKLRPEPIGGRIWQLYHETMKWGFVLTAATMLATYFAFDSLPVSYHNRIIILFTAIPWFLLIQGLVGLILVWEDRQLLNRLI